MEYYIVLNSIKSLPTTGLVPCEQSQTPNIISKVKQDILWEIIKQFLWKTCRNNKPNGKITVKV
jgi:hypothetical protein